MCRTYRSKHRFVFVPLPILQYKLYCTFILWLAFFTYQCILAGSEVGWGNWNLHDPENGLLAFCALRQYIQLSFALFDPWIVFYGINRTQLAISFWMNLVHVVKFTIFYFMVCVSFTVRGLPYTKYHIVPPYVFFSFLLFFFSFILDLRCRVELIMLLGSSVHTLHSHHWST